MLSAQHRFNPVPDEFPVGTSERMRQLEARLEDGYLRIEEARKRGEFIEHWEAFWVDLLHQYEASFQEFAQAA